MEEELVIEYLRRFNRAFSLKEREYSTRWNIDLSEAKLRDNQQDFVDRVLFDNDDNQDVFYIGAMIFYGFRIGTVRLKGKNECFTKQEGYRDNALQSYILDDILNEDTDDNNKDTSISYIIRWATNPGSNTEIAEAVLRKMISPLVKNLCKTIPPGRKTECTVVIPPFAEEIDIQDWQKIFNGIRCENLSIHITNYGHLFNLHEDERRYIFQYQTDGEQEFLIISAYELIRGHNTCIGSLAFDIEDSDRQYKLKDIMPYTVHIDNREILYTKKKAIDPVFSWSSIECKYPVSSGFNSFLGNHDSSFGRKTYKVLTTQEEINEDAILISSLFNGNEALQVVEICSRLLNEPNLYNISLGDLVYVANILERNKRAFKLVDISTNKKYQLGTHKRFGSDIDMTNISSIPSNFSSFTWKLHDKSTNKIPYFKLDAKKHSDKQIIESIIEHYDHCTTAMVAEEILYFYKHGEDPSAFFVVKTFLILSQMPSLEIESRNEYISSIENVDNIIYEEIDKSKIKSPKASTNILRISNKIKKIDSDLLSIPISQLKFSVRTFNSLQRSGINSVGDIILLTEKELYKVRNLGKRGVTEVIGKLTELGLELMQE